MSRYEREEWIAGERLSLGNSYDLEEAVRYVKEVHAVSGNHVRVVQIPGPGGTMSAVVFDLPSRQVLHPCPHCGSTSIELRMSDNLEFMEIRAISYRFKAVCRTCEDEGFEVVVSGKGVGDGKTRTLDERLEAQASAIVAWNRRSSPVETQVQQCQAPWSALDSRTGKIFGGYHTQRGIPLVYGGLPAAAPILTVENYPKWYGLYLVCPNGLVEEIDFGVLFQFTDETGQPPYVDHVPNARLIPALVASRGWILDPCSYEMMVGRWEAEVVSPGKYDS